MGNPFAAAPAGTSRRSFLAAAGAAIALPAALAGAARGSTQAKPSPSAAPPPGPTAGSYPFRAGAATCRLVSDGGFPMNPSEVLGKTPTPEELARAAREAFLDPQQPAPGQVNALLVEAGGKRLLVDTGCGPLFGPATGRLGDNLRAAGVTPESVDLVLLTHLHPDHVGGLLGPAGADAFPNARFLMSREEREFWSQHNPDLSKTGVAPEFQRQITEGARAALDAIRGRTVDVRGGESIDGLPGMEVIFAPGHTPGHVALRIGEGDDRVLYITDAVHLQPLQFPHPDWHVAFDADPDLAVRTRRDLLALAAADRVRISGAHLPFPGLANVRREGSVFGYVPVLWDWASA